jgi:N-dimethylarginine dimethylaminohydrolase
MFPRDPMIVMGDVFVESAPSLPPRRKERFSICRALGQRLDSVKLISVSEPLPAWDNEAEKEPGEKQAFLDGGEAFALGRDICLGNSGSASSSLGIHWLQKALGPEYRAHEVPLSKGFLHFDCALAAPRPDLALVCR